MSLDKVDWVYFQDIVDDRGRLTAIEENVHIPLSISRIFYVHQVKNGIDRGGHAHRDTNQVVACINGSVKIDVSNGKDLMTFKLNNPGRGIFVPQMLWVRLYDFSQNSICLVLADTIYDKSKSIRNWEEYLKKVK